MSIHNSSLRISVTSANNERRSSMVFSVPTEEEKWTDNSADIKKSTEEKSSSPPFEYRYKLDGNISVQSQKSIHVEVLCVCYTESLDFLAAGLTDGTLKLYRTTSDVNGCVKCWHYPTSQCLYTIRERRQTLGLAYHPQLPKFVTVGDDTNVYLYNEETKTQERVFHASEAPDTMDGHKSRVFAACFNPKSAHEIITGGWDDTVQFWDTRQPYAIRHISGVHICGDGLDISRNGKEVLTCAWQKKNSIQLWDYGSAKLITTLEPDNVSSLLYCGKYISNLFIACGGADANIFRVVDLRSHSTLAMVRNLSKGVYGMAIGAIDPKHVKRAKPSEGCLPKLAFCSGKTIFEIDAQPG